MPTIRAIRNRIRGVRNITKITRAMEMIAATKMKRAQERGLAGRPYAEKIEQVIADLAAISDQPHPLLARRPENHITVVHITPDRGLCGGLNSNINRMTAAFLLEHRDAVSLVTVGRKGRDFMARHSASIIAEFTGLGDQPSQLDTLPISRIVNEAYISGTADRVYLAYTRFKNTVTQEPVRHQLLPVQPAQLPKSQNVEYLYEPDAGAVLDQMLLRFVEMEVYHAILESIASEQSARMLAMRNATDNGKEIIDDLTLVYNKARQEAITKELLDIVGGVAAMETGG